MIGISHNLKLITAFVLIFFSILPARAVSTEESVTISVGESKTLYLPSSILDRNPYSVGFYTLAPDYVEVSSYTDVSVTLKGLKAYTSPVFVRCDYYYINDGKAYSGAYNYRVTVKGGNGGGDDAGGFYLNEHNITIKIGQTYKLGYTFTGDSAPVTWEVGGDPTKKIASVDSQGYVYGLGVGSVPVYAKTSKGRYDTCYVTVETNSDIPDPTLRDGDLITSVNSTPEGHNLYFSVLSANEKTAQTGFVNGDLIYISNGMRKANTVTIPALIKGFRVEHIQFKSLSSLNMEVPFEIILPPTLNSIDVYAFAGNNNLIGIEIPEKITEIPEGCFSKCNDLRKIVLPESLECIGYLAFEECGSLEK